ncbi:hypothetical protein JK628_13045 [Shewanella sp. KX20019]|uniref:hypothetical protein n=1 Tax=Shewanella sp. KX20019 TaxID=2803864 RepID=UPI001927F2EB|nr:hypothetical protein [Shewanella sp. KX20019]QQX78510.1 hypothetical protein JK628_13045 [Shewanella sp. KX20019]
MTKSFKPILATILVYTLFCGVWWIGHYLGKVQFSNINSVMYFLFINATLWALPICLEANDNGSNFNFKSHGFQLSIIALTSLIALASGLSLKGIELDHFIVSLSSIFLLVGVGAYINSGDNKTSVKLHWSYRLGSWIIGVISVQIYLVYSLESEVVSWSLF